ncbi:hypothetical protein ACWF99_05050 [Nocardia sp. NPDC055002]|uniref:hypothetical protein n=1 Tax=Nocardia sp. NPDC056952 TaxID=3345979 RepID=UPI003627B22E
MRDSSVERAAAPPWTPKPVSASGIREVLDYFGKCPSCGYPARASTHTVYYSDGSTTAMVTGMCESPCGWTGPVELTRMTDRRRFGQPD